MENNTNDEIISTARYTLISLVGRMVDCASSGHVQLFVEAQRETAFMIDMLSTLAVAKEEEAKAMRNINNYFR